MHGLILRRILGAMLLAGLVAMLASDPPDAFGQKQKKKKAAKAVVLKPADPTKKSPQVVARRPDGPRMSAEQLARHIDGVISKGLKAEQTDASPRCSDSEFVRRVYLDLAGKIPSAEQAVAFLDSKDPAKRAKLIDELLASKEFGQHQADIWTKLLLPIDSDNRRLVQFYPNLKKWLEEQFNAGKTWDKIVKELMTVTGEVNKPSPAIYWVANTTADKMTDNVTRMFLGVQLQCAQCHNHPFTDYKQNEYWEMAAFFMNVRPNGNPKAAAKNGKAISVGEFGKARGKRAKLPESAKILPPKFLKGDRPTVRPNEPLRPVVAEWMTSPNNPYFGRAMVNRAWGQLFGRGFVNPVDDMHDGNPNSHPQLLATIEHQFVAHGFDLKYLYRAVCNSDTYQRTSKPTGNNQSAGPELFARMAIKPLSGEQMFDSLTTLVGKGAARPGRKGGGAGKRGPANARDTFASFFSAEDGADPTEYHAGIPQVLRLMNAPALNPLSSVGVLVRNGNSQTEIVEKMYLTVLSRRPTPEDLDRVNAYLSKSKGDMRQGYAGLMWALLNSSEFALNR
jgi:hypothetical protein